MSVRLNHTIVHARDQRESAAFLAEILGVKPPVRFAHFDTVELANEVTLDFMDAGEGFDVQHFAFLVEEAEFDAIFGRIRERSIPYWADPFRRVPNEINTNDGGRGVYFNDPSGHVLEIITRPYGSGG
jgi:catechol 2,3-dioxygenase-like lactoylglutathione lyase family enzyme